VGFENELISQTNFPPPRTLTVQGCSSCSTGFSGKALETVPKPPPPGPEYAVIGLPYARRKADAGARCPAATSPPLVQRPCAASWPRRSRAASVSLTLICRRQPPSQKIFRPGRQFGVCMERIFSLGIRERQTLGRQVDQAA
jgi:hypothetical protein